MTKEKKILQKRKVRKKNVYFWKKKNTARYFLCLTFWLARGRFLPQILMWFENLDVTPKQHYIFRSWRLGNGNVWHRIIVFILSSNGCLQVLKSTHITHFSWNFLSFFMNIVMMILKCYAYFDTPSNKPVNKKLLHKVSLAINETQSAKT